MKGNVIQNYKYALLPEESIQLRNLRYQYEQSFVKHQSLLLYIVVNFHNVSQKGLKETLKLNLFSDNKCS